MKKRDFYTNTAAQIIIYVLFLASAVCMAEDVYTGVAGNMKSFLPIGILIAVSALLNAVFRDKKQRSLRMIGNTGLLLLSAVQAYVFYRGNENDLESGFFALSGDYLKRWNRYYGTSYSILDGDASCKKMAAAFLFFVVVSLLLFIAGMCQRRRLMAFVPAAVLVSELLTGRAPGYLSFVLFLLGLLSGAAMKKNGFKMKRAAFVMASAAVLFFGTSAFFQKPAAKITAMEKKVNQFQSELELQAKNVAAGLISGRTSDGTVDNHTPKYRNEEIMKVHLNRSYGGVRLYLRGYYGSDYTNGVWKNEDADFAEACKEHGITEEEGAYELAQMPYLYMNYTDGNRSRTCQISYTGIHDTNAYLPYGMNLMNPDAPIQFSGDYELKKEKKCTQISAEGPELNLDSSDAPVLSLDELLYGYSFSSDDSENGTWQKEQEFFSWYNDYAMQHNLTVPKNQKAVKALAKEILEEYREANERMNNSSVYGMYDDVSSINQERKGLAGYVQYKLSELGTYSLYLDSAKGEDPVEYFLSTSHTGYCVHFASAGVLLLRELGVPARFVSGYVTKPDGSERDTNATISNVDYTVLDSGAHAWVEVYYDDYGWFPVEMTPGYERGTSGYPTEWTKEEARQKEAERKNLDSTVNVDSETTVTEQDTEALSDTEEQQDTEADLKKQNPGGADTETGGQDRQDENANGAFSGIPSGMRKALFGILGIVLAIVLLFAGRYLYRTNEKKKERVFWRRIRKSIQREQYDEAVKQINRSLYMLLKKTCHLKKNPDDAAYLCLLKEQFPEISGEAWERYSDIAKKAAFSKGKVTKEEAEQCIRICKEARKQRAK